MLERNPKYVDRLIFFLKAIGLIRRPSIGYGDQSVPSQPRDSLDIAIALAGEPVNGVRARHDGSLFLIDTSHPQPRRRLRHYGNLLETIGEGRIVLKIRFFWQTD